MLDEAVSDGIFSVQTGGLSRLAWTVLVLHEAGGGRAGAVVELQARRLGQ